MATDTLDDQLARSRPAEHTPFLTPVDHGTSFGFAIVTPVYGVSGEGFPMQVELIRIDPLFEVFDSHVGKGTLRTYILRSGERRDAFPRGESSAGIE